MNFSNRLKEELPGLAEEDREILLSALVGLLFEEVTEDQILRAVKWAKKLTE